MPLRSTAAARRPKRWGAAMAVLLLAACLAGLGPAQAGDFWIPPAGASSCPTDPSALCRRGRPPRCSNSVAGAGAAGRRSRAAEGAAGAQAGMCR